MSDLTHQLADLSPGKRELLLRLLREKKRTGGEEAAIPRAPRAAGPLPPSYAQERLWFLSRLDPESSFYNSGFSLRLEGDLDAAALAESLRWLRDRHESLRSAFPAEDGRPVQTISPPGDWTLPRIDLSGLPAERVEQEGVARLADLHGRAFDLATGPLVRAALLRVGPSLHLLAFVVHHIVFDGWSIGVALGELATLYRALRRREEPRLPELPIQYADFAVWQRRWLEGGVLARQMDYWRRRLAGVAPLELPTDRPRPSVQRFRGAVRPIVLSRPLSDAVKRLAEEEGATLFATLLAAFDVLLMRTSGHDDVAVGTPVANRNREELEGLIGFFVNSLVLRADLSGDPGFREVLARVQRTAVEAFAHQDVPFERLVAELSPGRSLSHNPLFQILFALQNVPLPPMVLDGLALLLQPVEITTSMFDLTVSLWDNEGSIQGTLQYDTDLFDAATLDRLAVHFERLLEAIVDAPSRPVRELPLLTEGERHQIVVEWNATAASAPRAGNVVDWFEAHAAAAPEATAALSQEGALTYGELDHRANRLAHHLRRLGVKEDVPVGICAERGLAALVGLLAVLKAGGAYVPLDPAYPQERLAYMLADAGAPVLLTQGPLIPRLPAGSLKVVDLDAVPAEMPDGPPARAIDSDHLLYVIYTSGSTGRPKGVAMRHGVLANLIRWQLATSPVGAGARTLQFTSPSFDVSFQEIFATWCAGGALVVISEEERRDPEAMLDRMAEHRVERLFLPFVALHQIALAASRREPPASLREVITAGEALQTTGPVAELFAALPGATLVNQYGPAEAHVVTAFQLSGPPGTWAPLPPIGRPVDGARIHLLDRALQPVPVGVPGELYIGGSCLARGYLGRPALTAERFVPDPLGGTPGARLYRTGDLARHQVSGDLEFLGRNDVQVKIRGYRVEPGEVETELSRHPAVREAAVVPRRDGAGGLRLVAYVVPASAAESAEDLRRFLRERLPDYMVPALFTGLEALPLTPSGKVDRRALPDPDWEQSGRGRRAAPRTPAEDLVAAAWSEILGRGEIGVDDDFFDLGGHSLLATQVMSRVRDTFGVDLPVRTLFESPTVTALAAAVETARRGEELPPIRPVLRDRPLPASFAQQRLWFIDRLVPGGSFYNVFAPFRLLGPLDVAALRASLNELARRHESLRTTFGELDGRPVQVISPPVEADLPLIDLRPLPVAEREAAAQRLAEEEARRPFDLVRGPLMRALLVRWSDTGHSFLLTLHHIISDGWSIGILFRELGTLYPALAAGELPELPPLPVQFADFAVWQRGWLRGEILAREFAYWRRQLADVPFLQLPADRPRPAIETFRGALVSRLFSRELAAALQEFARRHRSSAYMVAFAGFELLLQRYSGQSDFAVGTTIANRHHTEIEGVVGFFANTLVLRDDLSRSATFRDLAARTRELTLEAYAHQDMPFEAIVGELQPERDLSRNPIFQVMLTFLNIPLQPLELGGLTLESLWAHGGVAKLDLLFIVQLVEAGLEVRVEYATDLFDPATIQRLLGHYEALLGAAMAGEDRPLEELSLLTVAERHHLLGEWNDTARSFAAPATLTGLLAAQVERTPDAPAVIFQGRTLTYRELDRRANRLARHLADLGVGPEVPVGIAVERGFEMMVGLLGILKAGGAYVPLDPGYPAERLAFILGDSRVPVLLTLGRLAPALPDTSARVLRLDDDWPLLAGESEAPVPLRAGPDHLAYVIYTSGSTGRPKGAMNSHRAIANRLLWMQEIYRLAASDRVLQKTPFGFDVSVWELFWPLMTGACAVLAEPEGHKDPAYLVRLIRQQRVTVLHFVPSMLQLFLEERDVGSATSVRQVIASGEALSTDLQERFFQRMPAGAALDNLYGPTEAAVDVTWWPCAPGSGRAGVPIGRPISNLRIHLLDRLMEPVPPGVAGELWIGGVGLARGYLGRPDLTAERFVPDPYAPAPGGRLYRTGDLARYRPEGAVEFLGRIDHQVKVRGFRIELGEIEAALTSHPAVREAVVTARERDADGTRLVAYVVPETGLEQQVPEGNDARHWEDEQILEWQSVYDEIYGRLAEADDPTFNIAGWNSSYTGEPIPAGEMRAWLDQTVERILSLAPRRVLEVGCGTGLLLFRLAPYCARYEGIDFSPQAIAYLERLLARPGAGLPQASVARRLADDFTGVGPGSFDAVVLNSVVQYFPGGEYLLRVLERAMEAVAPGGFIYLGDLHSLSLLAAFHASVELAQAPPSLPVGRLRHRIRKRLAQEHELAVAPAFFLALRRLLPRLGRVEIHLKRGRETNELIRFRYDVVLHVEDGALRGPVPVRCDWGREVADLRGFLATESPEALVVRGVPNARVFADTELVRLLAAGAEGLPRVDDLRRELAARPAGQAVEPEDVRDLAAALGLTVELTPSPQGDGDHFDVLLRRREGAWDLADFGGWDERAGSPWPSFFNNPLQGRLAARLTPELRELLAGKLPDYMVPAAFVVLESLPLSPNGKVDRRALPDPDWLRPEAGEDYLPPENPAEEVLARIWSEVLGTEKVGRHDNFFALGGDSILSIRVISRAAEASLELLPRHFFEHQTLAALAAAAKPTDVGEEGGAPPLTPLQHELTALHGSPRVLRLAVRHRLDPDLLRQAWQAVLELHPALRLGTAVASLEEGPRELVLTLDRRVADAASWKIVLEDLEAAYRALEGGGAVPALEGAPAFELWARHLARQARSGVARRELASWTALLGNGAPDGGKFVDAGIAVPVTVWLGEEETRALLREVPATYHTRLDEALLAALAMAAAEWNGGGALRVDYEASARREPPEGIDLSRAVGNFGFRVPLRLELPLGEPDGALKAIKDQMRALPGGGLGYGLLRWLDPDPEIRARLAMPPAGIGFEGLEEDDPFAALVLFAPFPDAPGPRPAGSWDRRVEVWGGVAGGRLWTSWGGRELVHDRASLETLAAAFLEALKTLIEHCQSAAGGFTPSDFPLARVDQRQLDKILARLGGKGGA